MSAGASIHVAGCGAVSSAGWGVPVLADAIRSARSVAVEDLPHPRGEAILTRQVRRVPPPATRPDFLNHPRLRRASPVSQFAAAAAMEALGDECAEAVRDGRLRCGILFSLLNGCVNYTGRFYGEVLRDPALASPILFPETVFNAPASHLAALLGSNGPAFTLVGDSAQFIPAVNIGLQWLLDETADVCLVVGAEECDWLTAEALDLLAPGAVLSEGAGALLLQREARGPVIGGIAGPVPISSATSRKEAAEVLRRDLSGIEALHISDVCGCERLDAPARFLQRALDLKTWTPLEQLGHAMGASAALQSVLAASSGQRALVTAIGGSQAAAMLLCP